MEGSSLDILLLSRDSTVEIVSENGGKCSFGENEVAKMAGRRLAKILEKMAGSRRRRLKAKRQGLVHQRP